MKEYNQLQQSNTFYACSIYALLNLFKYDYGIYVNLSLTLKFLIYLEKIGVFFRLEGAVAKYIFPYALNHINKTLGLNLVLATRTLDNKLSDEHGYILGFKRATSFYKQKAEDGEITELDIDLIEERAFNGHFHYYKRGTIVESLGGFRYRLKEENLKYAYSKDLYYPNIRYIYGEEDLQEELIKIVKFRKLQGLPNPYVSYDEIIKIKEKLKEKTIR